MGIIDEPIAAILAALLTGVLGWWLADKQHRQRNDELFLQALTFLAGGSQNRNLGISALELYRHDTRHRRLTNALLTGSAIYLLNASRQKAAAHELFNLGRIMSMLLDPPQPTEVPRAHLQALEMALQSALGGVSTRGTEEETRGLHADEADLALWLGRTKALLSQHRPVD